MLTQFLVIYPKYNIGNFGI